MGIFDTIHMGDHRRVPPPLVDLVLQTKSFPCPSMSTYELRRDGRLWRAIVSTKWVPDARSPFGGHLEETGRIWEPVKQPPELEVHGYSGSVWVSAVLTFKGGILAGVAVAPGG